MNKKTLKPLAFVILCLIICTPAFVTQKIATAKQNQLNRSFEIHLRSVEKEVQDLKEEKELNLNKIETLTKEVEQLKNQIK